MYRRTMGFLRGIGAGVIAGVAISAMSSRMMQHNRRFRRSANKAMRGMGGMVDNVTSIFR